MRNESIPLLLDRDGAPAPGLVSTALIGLGCLALALVLLAVVWMIG